MGGYASSNQGSNQHGTGSQNNNSNSVGTSTTQLPSWATNLNKNFTGANAQASGMGRDFLTSLLSNPYGKSAGGTPFGSAINNMFDSQIARAKTGNASQAGLARQGFMQGDALAQAQNNLLGEGTSAANSLMSGASPYPGLNYTAMTSPHDTTSNVAGLMSSINNGVTNTNGGTSGMGLNCCFIFVEAYRNKRMPQFVRDCRDRFVTLDRAIGYRQIAKWLVPAMRTNKAVRLLVDFVMIKPLVSFGGWLTKEPTYKVGWINFPITYMWFKLFSLIGRLTVYRAVQQLNETKGGLI